MTYYNVIIISRSNTMTLTLQADFSTIVLFFLLKNITVLFSEKYSIKICVVKFGPCLACSYVDLCPNIFSFIVFTVAQMSRSHLSSLSWTLSSLYLQFVLEDFKIIWYTSSQMTGHVSYARPRSITQKIKVTLELSPWS